MRIVKTTNLVFIAEDPFDGRQAAVVELRDGRARGFWKRERLRGVETERRFVDEGNAAACIEIQSSCALLFASEQSGEYVKPLHVAEAHRERPEDESLHDAVRAGIEEEHQGIAERER